MIKKLLILAFILLSFYGFSQATAYPVGNLQQCDSEVYNLTVQTGPVLGNQNPSLFTVAYFETIIDATNNVNAISNPTSYYSMMNQMTIYVRVTNTQDNSFDITNFTV
ncbi:MAG TPA: hypothetical protein VFQ50_09120, partial [Flavobacterium sp.]|nr:hypothetical protein [Flavobacterium sp.]